MILVTTLAKAMGLGRASIVLASACIAFAFAGFLTLYVTKDRIDAFVFYTSLGANSIETMPPGQGTVEEITGVAVMKVDAADSRRYTSEEVTIWQAGQHVSAEQLDAHLGAALHQGGVAQGGVVLDQTVLSRLSLQMGQEVLIGTDPSEGCRVIITGALTPKPADGSVGGRSLAVAGPGTCITQVAPEASAALAFDTPTGTPKSQLAWKALVDAPAVLLPTLAILLVSVGLAAAVAVRSVSYLTRATAEVRVLLTELGLSGRRVQNAWALLWATMIASAWGGGVALGALSLALVAGIRAEAWHCIVVWGAGTVILLCACLPAARLRQTQVTTDKEPA